MDLLLRLANWYLPTFPVGKYHLKSKFMVYAHIDTIISNNFNMTTIYLFHNYLRILSLSIVYINDVWTVGDVWNSQNIPKSKQRSGRILSNVFGKSDRNLQVENIILSQQLTESQGYRENHSRSYRESPTRNTAF